MAEIIETPGSGGGILPPYGPPIPTSVVNQNPGGGGSVPSILPPITDQIDSPTHANSRKLPPANPPVQNPRIPVGGAGLTIPGLVGVIDDCMRSVRVLAMPGAVLDVLINGVWRGTGIAPSHPPPPPPPPFDGNPIRFPYDPAPVVFDIPLAVCRLKIGDQIQIRQSGNGRAPDFVGEPILVVNHLPYSWLTQHFDNARTGWNPYETQLSVGNVNPSDFGELFQMLEVGGKPLEGQVYAQPLYMHQQYFPSKGAAYNIALVATEMNRVYAFDADRSHQGEFEPYLWKSILGPVGAVPVVVNDLVEGSEPHENMAPTIGITGTPVIDCGCNCGCDGCERCSTPTMYVVSKSKRQFGRTASFHLYLHAVDVITGHERPNSPVEITGSVRGTSGQAPAGEAGSYDGDGNVEFIPRWHLQRPGLLLLDGTVYVAFGSQNDASQYAYHGWIMSYDAVTLEQKNIFCSTPDAFPNDNEGSLGGGSIWMAGMGLASDGDAIYCSTGNGIYNANSGGRDFGCSILKLSKDLRVISWFTPSYVDTINTFDLDLGSGGVMVIPPVQSDPSPPNLLVGCGKDGLVMLLNRDSLGGFSGANVGWPPVPSSGPTPGTDNGASGGHSNPAPVSNPNAVDSVLLPPGLYGDGETINAPGVWGGPAFFNGPGPSWFNKGAFGQFIYYCGNGRSNPKDTVAGGPPGPNHQDTPAEGFGNVPSKLGFLRAFSLSNGKLTCVPGNGTQYMESPDFFNGEGGTIPVVSSNQQSPNTAIVWAINRNEAVVPGTVPQAELILRAYRANDLGQELFSANCGPWDTLFTYTNTQTFPPWQNAGGAFLVPTVINGRVYVGCDTRITVFGLI